jgi:hypothetical protein
MTKRNALAHTLRCAFAIVIIGYFLPWLEIKDSAMSAYDLAFGADSGRKWSPYRVFLVVIAVITLLGFLLAVTQPLSKSLVDRSLAPIGIALTLTFMSLSWLRIGYMLCLFGLVAATVFKEILVRAGDRLPS